MSTEHYSSERLSSIRSASDSSKAEKLIAKIVKGTFKPDDTKKHLGLKGSHKHPPEPDVVKAMLRGLEDLKWGSYDMLRPGLDEDDYLALLDKGVPATATVETGNRRRNLLTLAASHGWTRLARRLLDDGVDADANGDPYAANESMGLKLRPLHYTYMGGGELVRAMLLEAGAAPLEAEPEPAVLKDFERESRDVLRCRLQRYRLKYLEVNVPSKAGASDEAGSVSRFGGHPSLPSSEWPSGDAGPMAFVGQIVLSELKASPLPLPKVGVLYFFAEPFPHRSGRVVYRVEPTSEAAQGPSTLDGSYKMKFKRVNDAMQLPYPNNFYFAAMAEPSLTAARDNPFASIEEAIVEPFRDQGSKHQIGGHPFLIQNDPRASIDATVVTLLQVDQFKGQKTPLWGDNGIGHFFIRLDDLEAGNFDRAFFEWACA